MKVNYNVHNEINRHPYDDLGLIRRTIRRLIKWTPKAKITTVVFIDMCNSTSLKLDYDEIWQENLLYLHSKTKKFLNLFSGKYSKNLGDGILCYFDGKEQLANAFQFSFALLEHHRLVCQDLKMNGADSSLFYFNVKVGLAQGETYFLYKNDPFGLAVDLASRITNFAIKGRLYFPQEIWMKFKDETLKEELNPFLEQQIETNLEPFGKITLSNININKTNDNNRGR